MSKKYTHLRDSQLEMFTHANDDTSPGTTAYGISLRMHFSAFDMFMYTHEVSKLLVKSCLIRYR